MNTALTEWLQNDFFCRNITVIFLRDAKPWIKAFKSNQKVMNGEWCDPLVLIIRLLTTEQIIKQVSIGIFNAKLYFFCGETVCFTFSLHVACTSNSHQFYSSNKTYSKESFCRNQSQNRPSHKHPWSFFFKDYMIVCCFLQICMCHRIVVQWISVMWQLACFNITWYLSSSHQIEYSCNQPNNQVNNQVNRDLSAC